MPTGMLNSVPQAILSHNVTRLVSDSAMTTATNLLPLADQSTTSTSANAIGHTHIFLAACFGFVLLILATVLGNTLVLLALYLDKRLHSPSFYLIANMAIADLLLGKPRSFSRLLPSEHQYRLFRSVRPPVFVRFGIAQRSLGVRTRFVFCLARVGCSLLHSVHCRSDGRFH